MNTKFIQKLESKGFHVICKKARIKYWYTIFDRNFKLLYRFPEPPEFKGEVEFIDNSGHYGVYGIILPEVIKEYDKPTYKYIDFIRNALKPISNEYQYGIIIHYYHRSGCGGMNVNHSIRKNDDIEVPIIPSNCNKFILDNIYRNNWWTQNSEFILKDEEFIDSIKRFNTDYIYRNNNFGSSIFVLRDPNDYSKCALCKFVDQRYVEHKRYCIYKVLDITEPPFIDNLKIGDEVEIEQIDELKVSFK